MPLITYLPQFYYETQFMAQLKDSTTRDTLRKFDDTKWITRKNISQKDRQNNGKKKATLIKAMVDKIIHRKRSTGVNSGASEGYVVSVTSVVLLILKFDVIPYRLWYRGTFEVMNST